MSLFPENEPVATPPAENPASDLAPPPRRIPNLGHALLFVSFTVLMLFLFQVIFFALGKSPIARHAGAIAVEHPKLQIAILAATYLTTLTAAWLSFPLDLAPFLPRWRALALGNRAPPGRQARRPRLCWSVS